MKIDLERIGPAGLELDLELDASALDLGEGAPPLQQPARLSGRVERSGQTVVLRGRARVTLLLECARCLAEFPWSIDEEFRSVFMLQAEPAEPDEELTPDELETSYLAEPILDLAEAAREQVLLALPYKPVCRPDCAGLCPICGASRNTESCDCQPAPDPTRLKLKDLLGDQDPKGS